MLKTRKTLGQYEIKAPLIYPRVVAHEAAASETPVLRRDYVRTVT